jgi:hypothetical protein
MIFGGDQGFRAAMAGAGEQGPADPVAVGVVDGDQPARDVVIIGFSVGRALAIAPLSLV